MSTPTLPPRLRQQALDLPAALRAVPSAVRQFRVLLGSALLVLLVLLVPAASAVDDGTEDGMAPLAGATASTEDAAAIPAIVFPVVGPVTFSDTWGACRGAGCSRAHKGVDIFGHKLAPLVAAEAGTITFIRQSAMSISGNTVIIESDSGWRYLYIHLNNDGPGTDDGSNPQAWIVPNRLRVGDRVEAGQVIGYLGDSGNAETTPAHVHFEVHQPGVGAVNPTPFVEAAVAEGRRVTVASLASTPEGRARSAPVVTDTYRRLLDREPTEMELFAWTDRFDIGFATVDDLTADLTMAKPRRDSAGPVVRSFRVTLDRLPTLRELEAWEAAMGQGLTTDDLHQALVTSEAFTFRFGEPTDEEFVEVVYRNATGQDPSDSRLADWLEALASGEPRWAVTAHLADSYAVKNSTWHGLEVIQSFRAVLERLPDGDEYERWVAHLDAGGLIPDVVAGIRTDADGEQTEADGEGADDGEPPTEGAPTEGDVEGDEADGAGDGTDGNETSDTEGGAGEADDSDTPGTGDGTGDAGQAEAPGTDDGTADAGTADASTDGQPEEGSDDPATSGTGEPGATADGADGPVDDPTDPDGAADPDGGGPPADEGGDQTQS